MFVIELEEKGVMLLTGYEPFFDMMRNPSIEACRAHEGKIFNGYRIVVEEIPMDYTKLREVIEGHLEKYLPKAAICTGISSTGTCLNVERVAINIGSAEHPTGNFGYKTIDQPLNPEGPAAYFTTLPFREIIEAMNKANVPTLLSNSAGTVGCNQIFYHLMDHLARNMIDIPAGFFHFPRLPEHTVGTRMASMSLELSTRGMEVALEYLSSTLP